MSNHSEYKGPSELRHERLYLTHTVGGHPAILAAPERLKNPGGCPGWFAIHLNDETDLLRFAADMMNKADEMKKMREEGRFPLPHEERDDS